MSTVGKAESFNNFDPQILFFSRKQDFCTNMTRTTTQSEFVGTTTQHNTKHHKYKQMTTTYAFHQKITTCKINKITIPP